MRGATDEWRAQLCGTAHRWAAQDAALRPGWAQCPHAANRHGACACRTSHPRQLVSCTRRQKGHEKPESRLSVIWLDGRGGSSYATSCGRSCSAWGGSYLPRYFSDGGGGYSTLPNGSSMNNVTPTAAGRKAAVCPSVKGGGWLSVESQGSFFKDEGSMLRRIWQKLVALNHCRDIYGEDTLVAQGLQGHLRRRHAGGPRYPAGCRIGGALCGLQGHRPVGRGVSLRKGCLGTPEWISTHPNVPGKCRSP